MAIVDDLLKLQAELASQRAFWEDAWRDCADLCLPYASHKFDFSGQTIRGSLTGMAQEPKASQRSRERYDDTAAWAMERLTAGMESLITPRAQKWHSFSLDDPFGAEPSDVEEEWLDKLRDYHFGARYDPRSNFALANQKAIRSATTFGTGILFQEENLGRKNVDPVKVPFFYRQLPVIECYLGIDAYDEVDRNIRITEMTARQAASYFGEESLSSKLREALDDSKKAEQPFTFMHAVLPREEAGDYKQKKAGHNWASFWCEVETKHLIKHSGFFTFPFHVMWWDQTDNSPYGQSAPMAVLSNIKMLQVIRKSTIQAVQQLVKPPMATMEGIYNQRLNLNPGATNPGYLDSSGNPKAKPLLTTADVSFAERLIELSQNELRESLYVNLFQILVQNPQQTATEALIRANEKGELLGPAGAKIENGLAKAADREIDIVQRKGAFAPGSPLEPPASIDGKNVGVKFTGPLARLRRMQELQGVESVLGVVGIIGQYDASVIDRIDTDETLELTREIRGAPRKMFRTDDEVAEMRQRRAQQQEQMAALQAAEMMAGAAGKATPAIKAMQEAQAA